MLVTVRSGRITRLAFTMLLFSTGTLLAQSTGPEVNPSPAVSGPNGDTPAVPFTLADRAGEARTPLTSQPLRGLAQVGSANPLVDAIPELRDLPAPKWVRSGTRISYYWSSARVPPAEGAFWPDAQGDWVDEAGNRYRKDAGTGSEGVTQITVTSVGRKTVTLDTQTFLITQTGKPPLLILGLGSVEPAGAAADYWLNPAAVAQIPERIGRTFSTFRMPFTAAGKKYDALRVQIQGGAGKMTHIFDIASGVLLHSNVITRTDTGTSVSYVTYLGRRDLDLPWAEGEAPEWVADLQEMRYTGAQVLHVPTGEPIRLPVSVFATVTARGKNWMTYDQTVTATPGPGLGDQTNTSRRSCGPAQLGALWIPTDGFADLRRGQTLDEDPLTGMRTVVGRIGNDARGRVVVELVQDNVTQKFTFVYDRETGALVQFSRLDRQLIPSETTLILKLVK